MPLVITGSVFKDGSSAGRSPTYCKKKIQNKEDRNERCIWEWRKKKGLKCKYWLSQQMPCCETVGGTVGSLLQQAGTSLISVVPDILPLADIFPCLS